MTRLVGRMSVLRQPLDAILGSVAAVRVLRALLAHGGALPVSRLVRDTRVSPNGVRDALRLLEQAGVVDALGSGRTRLYATRRANPLTEPLEALFTAEKLRFDQVTDSIRQAASAPHVAAAWLFGSVARGEDTAASDTDIAIVIDAPETAVPAIADAVRDRLADAGRILAFTPSVIALSLRDLRRLRHEDAPLWNDLLADARVLAGPPPREAAGV
jgi:predicted nucleotidyltransferase/DNA-binding transcriptional regulator YhcF (GntR family)